MQEKYRSLGILLREILFNPMREQSVSCCLFYCGQKINIKKTIAFEYSYDTVYPDEAPCSPCLPVKDQVTFSHDRLSAALPSSSNPLTDMRYFA